MNNTKQGKKSKAGICFLTGFIKHGQWKEPKKTRRLTGVSHCIIRSVNNNMLIAAKEEKLKIHSKAVKGIKN